MTEIEKMLQVTTYEVTVEQGNEKKKKQKVVKIEGRELRLVEAAVEFPEVLVFLITAGHGWKPAFLSALFKAINKETGETWNRETLVQAAKDLWHIDNVEAI